MKYLSIIFVILIISFLSCGATKHHNVSSHPDTDRISINSLDDEEKIRRAEELIKKTKEYLPDKEIAKSIPIEEQIKEQQSFNIFFLVVFSLAWFIIQYFFWDHLRNYILSNFMLGLSIALYGIFLAKIRSWVILDTLILIPGDLFPGGYMTGPILFIIVGYILLFNNSIGYCIYKIKRIKKEDGAS